ncbi:restriction endonuclease subunit S [Shewanella oncorhynchi]|uniref:restriction endonuclease subunit S n=1 Tax=Shewanella oncorhynchi TaxID=2726434 RepID=UPI003D7A8E15
MIQNIPLGELFSISSGGTPSRKEPSYYEDGNIAWIKTGDLHVKRIFEASEYITQEGLDNSSAKLFPAGAVLVAMYGATIGACSILEIEAATNQACAAFLPNSEVDTLYLYYFLKSKKNDFVRDGVGGAQPNISATYLKMVEIPLPPLETQKQIAAVLEKADQLRKDCQLLEQELNSLAQSVFIEMFGDPATNPKGWEETTLGNLIEFAKDGPHVSPTYSEAGIPFLSTRHIKPNGVVWSDLKYVSNEDAALHWKKCKPEKGDVLYTKGGTTGVACPVNFNTEFAVWVHVALLRPITAKVDYIWLSDMLNMPDCYNQSQNLTRGATNKDLGLKRMVNIEMYCPPLAEQKKYSDFITNINEQLSALLIVSQQYEVLFNSLIQKAFNGELNLVNAKT